MKKEQKKELRAKTVDELIKELRDLRSEVSKLKVDMKTGKATDMNSFYKKKKDIARVLTYLSEKREEAKVSAQCYFLNNMATKTVKKTTVKKAEVKTESKEKKVMKQKENKNNRTMTGTVVSTKMQGTVVVSIERKVAHKLYGKLIKVTKRIKADKNGMEVSEGEVVVIEQTRPISKDKNFKVIKKEEGK